MFNPDAWDVPDHIWCAGCSEKRHIYDALFSVRNISDSDVFCGMCAKIMIERIVEQALIDQENFKKVVNHE
jgi:hypothetical protein